MRTRSENRFKAVTAECFNRGSSPNSAWIPAKTCGNDELASQLRIGSFILVCERMLMNRSFENRAEERSLTFVRDDRVCHSEPKARNLSCCIFHPPVGELSS